MRKLTILIVSGGSSEEAEQEAINFMESLIRREYIESYVPGGNWNDYFGIAKSINLDHANMCPLWKYGKGDDICPYSKRSLSQIPHTVGVYSAIIDVLGVSISAKIDMREDCSDYTSGLIDISTLTGKLAGHFRGLLNDTLSPGHIPVVYNLYTGSPYFTLRDNEYAVVMDYEPEDSNADR